MRIYYILMTILCIIGFLYLCYQREKRLYEMRKRVLGLNKRNKNKYKRKLKESRYDNWY